MGRYGLRALGAAAAMMAASWAGAAQTPPLAALAKLETGEWELRVRDDPAAPVRKLCVQDPQQLLAPQPGAMDCKRFVVRDVPMAVTVTYDCGGRGSARTDLRVETPRLVQIGSQGVADGAPYEQRLEGRRVGACR